MNDHVRRADELKREATDLLNETGLLTILGEYGVVHVTGSYSYDVMTWRDIDICLEVEQVELPPVFNLGREIASLPNVASMYFRNEFVLKTPGNPTAVFWCIDFVLPNDVQWKVDVLISTADHVKPIVEQGARLTTRLTARERETVLEIKGVLSQQPEYRREFRSSDIYAAVLDHGVASVEEWHAWRKNNAKMEQSSTPENNGR
jgi:hypothetical protein